MEFHATDPLADLSAIRDARDRFIATGEAPREGVRPVVVDSWKRSREKGIDPNRVDPRALLSRGAYERHLEEHRGLVDLARPFMEALSTTLRRSNYVVVLYSREGYHLEIVGSPRALSLLNEEEMDTVRRVSCREEAVGTCGFGLVEILAAPVQIVGPEHYSSLIPRLTGSYAPIYGEARRLEGVLAVTSLSEPRSHPHTLGMVLAGAVAIESRLKHARAHEALQASTSRLRASFQSVGDGLLLVDASGIATEVNDAALSLLGRRREAVLGRPLGEFSDCRPPLARLGGGDETVVFEGGEPRRAIVSATPIRAEGGGALGTVFLFKGVDRIERIVRRLSTAQALYGFDDIVGESRVLEEARRLSKLAAATASTVLIEGESGTGKELFSHAIHRASPRAHGPFVAVNCSAIPADLFESVLFGYEKGAFTGARSEGQAGKFELADGGTLYLDEVGDLPLGMQVKLLRALGEGQIEHIGGRGPLRVDVRVIASTNRSLVDEVAQGRFRLDLYYRLNVMRLVLPPLRERKEDLGLLVRHFVEELSPQLGRRPPEIAPEVVGVLRAHAWPGNLRELRNVVERSLIVLDGATLEGRHLPESLRGGTRPPPAPSSESASLAAREKEAILAVLRETRGNKARAAKLLGIGRYTLYRKLKLWNL